MMRVRFSPPAFVIQRQVVARCRRRNAAEEHMRVIRLLLPSARFAIAFDPALEQQNSSDEGE
ncbi:MAG TPA: hypothetical protein DCE56_31590 [Cyanobacteria bacterium UBA8553]|nr:hypothetical protein [Cyanobacteria bacterium UBA8553]HAJ60651.1 hypothetical protein [Cyanobacteria bacterium UBA8543]